MSEISTLLRAFYEGDLLARNGLVFASAKSAVGQQMEKKWWETINHNNGQWIGLRENLQENIDFSIKYGAFL